MSRLRKKLSEEDYIEDELPAGYTRVCHTLGPIYDETSRILILGSFPSVKSREQNFYYGHPQNRFWKLMARLFEEPVPETTEDKKRLLTRHHIALWDVVAACDIKLQRPEHPQCDTHGLKPDSPHGRHRNNHCQRRHSLSAIPQILSGKNRQGSRQMSIHQPCQCIFHAGPSGRGMEPGALLTNRKQVPDPNSPKRSKSPRFFLPKAYKTGMMEIHLNIIIKL